ncbi:preprotein translocase subunit SecY [candidate division WWE3 bacterium]|nr:preprotein translocase subunit SecY [candidate division WWE3 bacterium]
MLKILGIPELRKKIFFTFFAVFVFRFLAHIPVPGVDVEAIRGFLSQNVLLGFFSLFSGGGFSNFSIVTLGLSPYITSSIIIQLFTMMIPSLEELSKEGESGREKINQYTKYLSIPLAFIQAYGVYFLLNAQQNVIPRLDSVSLLVFIFTLTGGAMLLTWLGDLVTEYGIGQGISLLIFVGIISSLPSYAANFILAVDADSLYSTAEFLVVALLVVVGVVLVNEGTRNIPLEYGRKNLGVQRITNYLPIKVNQAGMIPIIFAISIVSLPSFFGPPLASTSIPILQKIGSFLVGNFSSGAAVFNAFYFLLVFGFTFFYTTVQFDPGKIADDVKKRGGFVPGVRPGLATQRYLDFIVKRLTFGGAAFLGLVAVVPNLITVGGSALAIGGTGIIIVVSVVLETIRQVESMMVTRNYDRFLE